MSLLSRLASNGPSAGMEEALAMTRRLKAELPAMLAEHGQIVEALQKGWRMLLRSIVHFSLCISRV